MEIKLLALIIAIVVLTYILGLLTVITIIAIKLDIEKTKLKNEFIIAETDLMKARKRTEESKINK